MSIWKNLKLKTTTLKQFFTHRKKIDISTLEELEDLLISSDFGYQTVKEFNGFLKKERFNDEVDLDFIKNTIKIQLIKRLENYEKKIILQSKPHVILMVGVNGSGKTTTISKLSNKFLNKKIIWSACDTFRAGAVDQLDIWAKRLKIELLKGTKDPSALAYQSFEYASKEQADLLVIDTAGRLQNNINFMEELKKIFTVLKKITNDSIIDVLIVLDGTVGQNAISQVQLFKEYLPLTGCIMTKLDGSAKGGILVRIVDEFKLPIIGICSGEKIEDFEYFNAKNFIDAIFE